MLSAAKHGTLRNVSYAKNQQKGIFQVLHAYLESFYVPPYVHQACVSNSIRIGLALRLDLTLLFGKYLVLISVELLSVLA